MQSYGHLLTYILYQVILIKNALLGEGHFIKHAYKKRGNINTPQVGMEQAMKFSRSELRTSPVKCT